MAEAAAVEPAAGRPTVSWLPWTAPIALIGGLILAALLGLVVDLPAVAFGVKITSSHTPQGIQLADTFVQDLAFVAAAIYCAHIGGRKVSAWQFGLRPPAMSWARAAGAVVVLLVSFAIVAVLWAAATDVGREKVLDQLGVGVLSAAVVCVAAPMSEEFLFRGYIFTALCNWRGTALAAVITALLFGAVHAGSAPALDLVPLALLGLGLCILYKRTDSLYPCMAAHSLNNSVAFASLAKLDAGEGAALAAGALAGITLIVFVLKRTGVITPAPTAARLAA
jgi:membrane protease YdiL (CAAX protease family)